MAKNYMGVNLTGRSLMHYRTKGSRNGYSKDPNYRPTGQRAIGRLVNGRYVYDQGAQNNWQQQAAAAQNQAQVAKRIKGGTSKSGNLSVDGFDFNVSNHGKTITDYSTARAHQNAVNQANAEARARNAIANRGSSGTRKITKQLKTQKAPYVSKEYQEELAYNSKKNVYPGQSSSSSNLVNDTRAYKEKKSAMGYRYSPAYSNDNNPLGYHITDPRYTTAGTQKIENAAEKAAEKAAKTNEPQSVARAESLIRQIKGNRARMAKQIDRENPNASRYARKYAKAMTGPKANIDAQFTKAYSRNVEAGGAMKNDPRYSSKSVYISPNGYAHTSQEIAKEIGEGKNRGYTKASPIGSRMDAARGSVNRSIRKAKREVANTASKAYNTASKYASAAANKAKSAASSASKAASSAVATGKKTVDDLLNKFKKKKK